MRDIRAQSIELVHEFGRAWERCDIDAILGMLAPDAVYQNVPVPAMVGRDAIRRFITPNLKLAERTIWEFLATEADAEGKRVLTERVDSFVFPEGTVAAPVMGIFEIENGLIARWRDYCDLGTFVRDMQAIGRMPGPGIKKT
jgi:limonene-1,2-epoxide hydrolase